MCMIIDNSAGLPIDDFIMEDIIWNNPDGFGFIDLTTNKVKKTMDMNKAYEFLQSERPFVAHCRYATTGKVAMENVHPVMTDHGWLMQNGTVKGLHGQDTHAIGRMLGMVKKRSVRQFLESFKSRFLLYDGAKVHRFGTWHEYQGVMYSKPVADIVAVYGTLKYGHGNHHFLEEAEYLGDCTTANKMRLCIDGLPFLIEGEGEGKHVECEMYAVDDWTLDSLDKLEGHPDFYRRDKLQFKMGDDIIEGWSYLVGDEYDNGKYHVRF